MVVWFCQAVRRFCHVLTGCLHSLLQLRPGLSRWMHRERPVMIRLTDWATIWPCLRNMASTSRPGSLIPFLTLVRLAGRS